MSSRLHDLASLLQCPRCEAATWSASGTVDDGALACRSCGAAYACTRGVLDLGEADEDAQVTSERAAARSTERRPELGGIDDAFDHLEDAEGDLRDAILALPYGNDSRYYSEPGYFSNVRGAVSGFDFVLRHLDLRPGQRLLDLGADTTWSTSLFARQGVDCTAVDINHHLAVGQLFAAHFGTPYHLVRADMRRVPFRPSTFDIVVALHALHHNPELGAVAATIARVLCPGGRLAFVEPYCADDEAKRTFGLAQIAAGISEQTYLLQEWHDALVEVGLEVEHLRVCESFCAVYRKRTHAAREATRGLDGLFEHAYAGRVALAGAPASLVAAGTTWTVPITVENTSRATWCSTSQFPVYASYHLHRRTEDGNRLVAFDHVRSRLAGPVAPGERASLSLEIAPIDVPGDYVADIDLVHEHVSWFAAHGFGGCRLEFRVRPATPSSSSVPDTTRRS